jgi:hypothetical protein
MAAEVQAAVLLPATRARTDPWWQRLFSPVDGASLGVFRVIFGVIILLEVFPVFLSNEWVRSYYI